MSKPIIIKVKEDENGNILLSESQLQEIVDNAYMAGYADGTKELIVTDKPLDFPPITSVYAAPEKYPDIYSVTSTDGGGTNGTDDD